MILETVQLELLATLVKNVELLVRFGIGVLVSIVFALKVLSALPVWICAYLVNVTEILTVIKMSKVLCSLIAMQKNATITFH